MSKAEREVKRKEAEAAVLKPIEVDTGGEHFVLKGRSCELSGESFVPPQRNIPHQRAFYNNAVQHNRVGSRVYDSYFSCDLNYNQKLHREDRRHAKLTGLAVLDEERVKRVPSISTSAYGHWNHWEKPPSVANSPGGGGGASGKQILLAMDGVELAKEPGHLTRLVFDASDRQYVMRNQIENEFYRRNKVL